VEKIRVFIGSGEASVIERKVLIYSIRKNTPGDVDIYVFNGTHNSLERNDEPPVPLNMSLRVKYKNTTEFSNYRFLIPELCKNEGRAIFIDSDTICLSDIGKLFHQDMNGFDLIAKKNAYEHSGEDKWGLSVMLLDCRKCKFDLEQYWDEIEAGKYSSSDYHQLSAKFLKYHPLKVGPLDPNWNDFDHYGSDTKVIHYSNLYSQPWKSAGHKFGKLWFDYFNEARKKGYVTEEDIDKAILRSYVRKDLKNATHSGVKYHLKELLHAIKASVRN
jgi:lipopolysaccharide biosynthesis glycosyltransferase